MASIGINTDLDFSAPTSSTPAVGASKILKLLTASRVVVTNGSGDLAASSVTSTELGYLSGVTSAIQTQLNAKITAGAAAIVNADISASAAIALSKLAALTASRALVSDGSGVVSVATTTTTQLNALASLTNGRIPFQSGGALTDSANATLDSSGNAAFLGSLAAGTGSASATSTLFIGQTAINTQAVEIKLASGATANAVTIRNNAGTAISAIDNSGQFNLLGNNLTLNSAGSLIGHTSGGSFLISAASFGGNGNLVIRAAAGFSIIQMAQSATSIPVMIRGAALQTANLTEWQDSAGTVLTRVNSIGQVITTSVGFVTINTAAAYQMWVNSTPTLAARFNTNSSGDLILATYNGSSWSDSLIVRNASLNLEIVDSRNVILGTTTGTKIGTATTQKIGFFNSTPIVQPSAYTQTYATADKTHANFTSADIGAFTGGSVGFLDAAERDNIRTQFNALRADVADLKQIANSIIDDLQALGLVG